jgi:hypothetical protein
MMTSKKSRVVKALLLFTVTVLTRLPFTSRFLYNWDSVQYALATENFNITYHQPHPPGYIVYVAAGKALNLLTDDPNRSFIIISILASAVAVSSLYLFGVRAMGGRDGIYAAMLLLLNPVFWFYGEIASTYTLECLLAILIAWICFLVRSGEEDLAPWAGVLIAVAGGIRQTTAVLLLPLVIFSLRKARPRQLLITGTAFVAVTLTWLLPLLHFGGGTAPYLEATRQLSKIDTWRWSFDGVVVGLRNLSRLAVATGIGLHIMIPILIAFLFGFFPFPGHRASWEKWFAFWWTVPSTLLYSLHYGQPGYALVYLPVILLYLPPLIRGFLDDLKVRIKRDTGSLIEFGTGKASLLILAFAAIVNIALFLYAPWEASAHSIAVRDIEWQSILDLREDFPPDNTIVLTEFFTSGSFRHASYYLPEYLVYCVGADDEVGVYGWLFRTQNRVPSYNLSRIEVHETIVLPADVLHILILDDSIAAASDIPLVEIPVTSESVAYVINLNSANSTTKLVFEDYRLELR